MAAAVDEGSLTQAVDLPEDVLLRILTTSGLSIVDVLNFGASGKPCSDFVQDSSRLWLMLLTIHFPEQRISDCCREDAQSLRHLFIKRYSLVHIRGLVYPLPIFSRLRGVV